MSNTTLNKDNLSYNQLLLLSLGFFIISKIIFGLEFGIAKDFLHNKKGIIDILTSVADCRFYVQIALAGYETEFIQNASIHWPFMPFFPILIKLFSLNGLLKPNIVAWVINQIFVFLIFILLPKYLRLIKFNDKNIIFALCMLTVSPASIYFNSGLSEPTFLLLMLLGFMALELDEIWWAVLIGAFISSTRIVGAGFVVPLFYYQYKKHGFRLILILQCLLAISGLLIYMVYMQIHTGWFWSFIWVEHQIKDWARPGLSFSNGFWHEILRVISTSHNYDKFAFFFCTFFVTYFLVKAKFYKEALYNLTILLPVFISGHFWNTCRFGYSILPFYLGLVIMFGNKSELIQKFILCIMLINSFAAILYWISGSYYFW